MRELPRIGGEIGNYRLESLVSRGGMAVIYLAEDLRLGRKVALKLLALELAEDDRFRERFLRESRIAASIDHPNVIPIFDAGEVDGLLYIAMRHVEDPDLRQLLRAEGPLEIERAVSIAIQVAGGLGAAHARGLVHRDVKPANILMIHRRSARAADHVYLSDFGIAKHASSVSGLTATGQLVGTVSYTAPEQIEGHEVDGRTDIYSFGCVLFECLAGRPAFKKEADVAVLMAHINEPAPAVTSWRPDCPTDLAQIVAKTLEKDPADRYQTCDELIDALRGIDMTLPEVTTTRIGAAAEAAEPSQPSAPSQPSQPSQPSAPQPSEPAAAAPPTGRAPRLAWLLGGLGALAVVAVALVLALGGGDDEEPERAATVDTAPTTTTGGPPNVQERWRGVRTMGIARQQVGAAPVGGRVCVVGGLTGVDNATKATDIVQAYDPAIDTWITTTKFPHPIHHPMAVSFDGKFTVIGGFIPEGANLTARVSDEVWQLQGTTWKQLPSLEHPRAAAAAAVVDGKIVVVGGQAKGELVAETEVFD
ncbi:MAG TPA: protein kinase, partial [Solirubrobacteraceae bacterium]